MKKIFLVAFISCQSFIIHSMENSDMPKVPQKKWYESFIAGVKHDFNEFTEETDKVFDSIAKSFDNRMQIFQRNINHIQATYPQEQAKFNIVEQYITYGKKNGCNKEQVTKFIEFCKQKYSEDQKKLEEYFNSLDSQQQQ